MNQEMSSEDQHGANLIALAFLLRQMAAQLLQEGQADEARSFVDLIETLRIKTEGNRGEQETKAIEDVLFQLRMAVVKGPPPQEDSGPDGGAPSETDSPPESPKAE